MLGVGCIRVFTSLIPAIDGTPNILGKPVNPHSEKKHSGCIIVRGFQSPIAVLQELQDWKRPEQHDEWKYKVCFYD